MIFVGVILSELVSCSSQKCRLQMSAVVLFFKTDLFSSFVSLLLPHFTWFYSLSCPSMAISRGYFVQKWNQTYSHRRCVLLPRLSNLNHCSSSENGLTFQYLWHYCSFLTYPTWLIDWLICVGEWVVPWHAPECSPSAENSSMASQW